MRSLHVDTLAKLKTDHLRAKLLHFDYTPAPVYLTDAPVDIVFDGNTYLGNGMLLGVGDSSQSADIRVSTSTITFDAVDPSMVAILLSNPQHGRAVNISIAILNDDFSVAGLPILMQSMIIDGLPKITDDPSKGKAIIKQKISSEFANWAVKNGRMTTPNNQQKYFPSDTGFDFAAESGKEYPWGRS